MMSDRKLYKIRFAIFMKIVCDKNRISRYILNHRKKEPNIDWKPEELELQAETSCIQ